LFIITTYHEPLTLTTSTAAFRKINYNKLITGDPTLNIILVVTPTSRHQPIVVRVSKVLLLHGSFGGEEDYTLLLAVELTAPLNKVRGDKATLRAKDLGFDFI